MTDIFVVSVVLDDKIGLQRTAVSVLGQLDVDLHWVIADGGSSDGSAELAAGLESRSSRVTFLPGPDRGIYHGMNRALGKVPDGALVWFLNAGDFFLSNRSVVKAAGITDSTGWSGGPMVLVGESGLIHHITAVPSLAPSTRRPGIHLPAQPTILMSKSLYTGRGGFREDLRLASDGVFYQGLAKTVAPAVYPEPLVGFTLGGRSSRHFRRTLVEFWDAGYRPEGFATRIMDRDLGQARTWARGLKLRIKPRLGRPGGSADEEELPFEHWAEHKTRAGNLSCCIEMGRSVDLLQNE